jgi:hypothetical protein
MRKESLMFVGSAIASIYVAGAIAVVGLFIFGFTWLVYGDD